MIGKRLFKHVLAAMCLALSANCVADVTPPDVSNPVTAIWRVQRLPFTYHSNNVYYSCDGLRDKIAAILKAVGARKSIDVDLRCRSGAFMNGASTVITLASPIEATPENVTAATTYSPEAQLAARLNGRQLPTANDVERFDAEWRPVTLHRTRGLRLDGGDCELLHGLAKQIFPHISVRIIKQGVGCNRGGTVSSFRPKMEVAALMPSPVVPLAFAPAAR